MANVLANAGRAIITNLLAFLGNAQPKYVGWGTGAGTSAVTDTTLFSEKALDLATGTGSRQLGTCTQQTTSVANDTLQVVSPAMVATGAGTVTNAGVFDLITIGSGNLFIKGDFAGIPLNTGDAITFTLSIQFT